jgi:cytochrome c peroxidase
MPIRLCITGIFVLFASTLALAHSGHKDRAELKPQILAPGYHALNFDAPLPGTYSLPRIGMAADGNILTMEGQASTLHEYLGDKYVVLSFIYTQCDDVNGCPLATYVSSQVQNRLIENSDLQNKVRFISLSFDPKNDTPEVMRQYGANFIKENFDWQFLTTISEDMLNPILEKYSQSILKEVDENGNTSSSISHILRVFLIDIQKQVRNIYSTSFLHPDTVVNDIKTLELDFRNNISNTKVLSSSKIELHGAGDDKEGYEYSSYQTQTSSLQSRIGRTADLYRFIEQAPLGLPSLKAFSAKKITRQKIQLGRQLFYDRRLSHNNTFSCAMCHIPEQGFGSNELATAVGVEGRTVRRNAPSLYNVGYSKLLFHDGRENSLEQQIWGPLLAHNEMANPSIGRVIEKIKSIDEYRQQFHSAFNGQEPDMYNIGEAIASYERTLVSANSHFDRWYYGGDKNAMSMQAKAGYALFTGKGRCSTCHTIDKDHALFTDHSLHNTGIGYFHSMQKEPVTRKVLVAPGTWLNVESKVIADSAEAIPNDLGYYEISEDPDDRWKFKTPTLRNIALTAPYMHNGSFSDLTEVVEFYNRGGISNELLDPLLQPLQLSPQEVEQIVVFLNNLTGDNIDTLISDAFAAPIGNTN